MRQQPARGRVGAAGELDAERQARAGDGVDVRLQPGGCSEGQSGSSSSQGWAGQACACGQGAAVRSSQAAAVRAGPVRGAPARAPRRPRRRPRPRPGPQTWPPGPARRARGCLSLSVEPRSTCAEQPVPMPLQCLSGGPEDQEHCGCLRRARPPTERAHARGGWSGPRPEGPGPSGQPGPLGPRPRRADGAAARDRAARPP